MTDSFEARYRKFIKDCAKLALRISIGHGIVSVCFLVVSALNIGILLIGGLFLVMALLQAGGSWFWWREYRSLRDELKQREKTSKDRQEAMAQWANDAIDYEMKQYYAWQATNAKAETTE